MSFFFFFLSFFIFFLSVSALFSLYSCSQFLYSSPSHLLYDDIHSSISRSLISANTNPPNFPGPLLLLSPTRLLLRSVKFFTFSFSRCHFLFFSVFFFFFLHLISHSLLWRYSWFYFSRYFYSLCRTFHFADNYSRFVSNVYFMREVALKNSQYWLPWLRRWYRR